MIPALQDLVVAALKHPHELIRKKAIMCLHRISQLDPGSIDHLLPQMRQTLCDKDPAVMAAALCLLTDLVRKDPAAFKDLVPSFVSILKQVAEHRLPREYDYHRMPAPWVQIRLLRLLGLLGYADQASSEQQYEILADVMRRADTSINVGYAIMYECIRTITSIYPNPTLLDQAAASISRFIKSTNHNLKCVFCGAAAHPPPPTLTDPPPPASPQIPWRHRPHRHRQGPPQIRGRASARGHRLPRGRRRHAAA